jgi:hypothetical protein
VSALKTIQVTQLAEGLSVKTLAGPPEPNSRKFAEGRFVVEAHVAGAVEPVLETGDLIEAVRAHAARVEFYVQLAREGQARLRRQALRLERGDGKASRKKRAKPSLTVIKGGRHNPRHPSRKR